MSASRCVRCQSAGANDSASILIGQHAGALCRLAARNEPDRRFARGWEALLSSTVAVITSVATFNALAQRLQKALGQVSIKRDADQNIERKRQSQRHTKVQRRIGFGYCLPHYCRHRNVRRAPA